MMWTFRPCALRVVSSLQWNHDLAHDYDDDDERVIAHCLLALQFTLGKRLYEQLLLSKTSGS